METKFIETLAYLKANCTKTINLHTLKSIFLKFVYYYFVYFLYCDVKIRESIEKRIKTCNTNFSV